MGIAGKSWMQDGFAVPSGKFSSAFKDLWQLLYGGLYADGLAASKEFSSHAGFATCSPGTGRRHHPTLSREGRGG